MRGRFGSDISSRLILAAIVLTANVGAPFSTSRLVRVFLRDAVKNAAAQSVARVRVVSQVGSFQGFRAVVGCSGGGSGKIEPGSSDRVHPAHFSRRVFHHSRHLGFTASRPNPPLRC
jgi:hypothetical protein